MPCSTHPILYDETKCVGCNACVNICQVDILIPSPEKGKHPIELYPGECYYCGACVMAAHQDIVASGMQGYVDSRGKADIDKRDEYIMHGDSVIKAAIR